MVSFVPVTCLESQVLPCCCELERKSPGINRNKAEDWGCQQGRRRGSKECLGYLEQCLPSRESSLVSQSVPLALLAFGQGVPFSKDPEDKSMQEIRSSH